MQFLKTLFWVVLAVAAMVFAMRNWTTATVSLWGGLVVEAKLPVLIYGAFLLGLLPTYAWHRAARWRLNRRIDSHARALAGFAEPVTPAPALADPDAVTPPPATVQPPAQS